MSIGLKRLDLGLLPTRRSHLLAWQILSGAEVRAAIAERRELSRQLPNPVDQTNVRYPLSLRNVEDLLFERGIDICHETVRLWWNRFGPMFAAEIRRKRVQRMRSHTHWRWHLD